jgi:hypothetical protein
MLKIIGMFLIAAPFVAAIMYACAQDDGWGVTIVGFVIALAVIASIVAGSVLVVQG